MDASLGRAARYGRAAARWARLLAARGDAPAGAGPRVFYGHDLIPGPDEPARGGTAKFQRLDGRFPNHPTGFDLLYLGSTWLPRDLRQLLWLADRRHTPIVVNQNGVGYPAWAGADTEAVNEPLRRALLAADHVLYQSEFCKRSADLYLGEPRGAWEILANAVDVDRFTPAAAPPAHGPVLLLAGDQLQPYRLELALRTLEHVRRRHEDARLLVLGRVEYPPPDSPRRGCGAPRPVHAARCTRALSPCAPLAAHDRERLLPERGDRGDGVRSPRRPSGERGHGRARRRGGGNRRSAPGVVGARAAAGAGGARGRRRARARCA